MLFAGTLSSLFPSHAELRLPLLVLICLHPFTESSLQWCHIPSASSLAFQPFKGSSTLSLTYKRAVHRHGIRGGYGYEVLFHFRTLHLEGKMTQELAVPSMATFSSSGRLLSLIPSNCAMLTNYLFKTHLENTF